MKIQVLIEPTWLVFIVLAFGESHVVSESTAPIPSLRISKAKALTTISCPFFQERQAHLERLS